MPENQSPVILEAALNGETRPEKNPNVPRKPEEIAADAVRCLDAGAALLHAHNDDILQTGRSAADLYLAAWRPVLAARPGTLWYPTLTGAPDVREMLAHIEILAAEVGLRIGVVDPGSTNLGGPDAEGLPTGIVYANGYDAIRYGLALCEGATFDNVNPATEEKIGVAADGTKADMEAAITAARRAFDGTGWSEDAALRARCLRQLHAACVEALEELRQVVIAEAGSAAAAHPRRAVRRLDRGPALLGRPRRVVSLRAAHRRRDLHGPAPAGASCGASRPAWWARSHPGTFRST
jgi:hypothetical protein